MKIVIAPDSFKESLSAAEVAAAIAAGLGEVWPQAELLCRPMADGGEGTVEAVIAAVGGERRETLVRGPLGEPVMAHWGWVGATRSAVIEMAAASGLHRVPANRRDALRSCTYGTGELILAALEAGAGRIVLAGLDPRLAQVDFEVACDVDNPLCGPRGASHVFGPQKGATPEQVRQLDAALARFADVCAATLGRDARNSPGSGAAGGIGFAARTFLGAAFRPGIELVAEVSGLEQAMAGADLVITGEGRIDEQTLHGKTPMGVAGIAKRHGVPVIALAGMLGEGYERLYGHGIDAAFSLVPGPISLAAALADAPILLRRRAADIARLWRLARG